MTCRKGFTLPSELLERVSNQKTQLWPSWNEPVKRLLAEQCELCGSTESIRVHHVRKLKDIEKRYKGRPDPPQCPIAENRPHNSIQGLQSKHRYRL